MKWMFALVPFFAAGYALAGLFVPGTPSVEIAQAISTQAIEATPTDLEAFEATAVELNEAGFPT